MSDPSKARDRSRYIYKQAWRRTCLDVGLAGESDELREPGLVDGGGDEFAAEDDMGEQDGEVAAGLRIPALAVLLRPTSTLTTTNRR